VIGSIPLPLPLPITFPSLLADFPPTLRKRHHGATIGHAVAGAAS
jgi:hypothetical protein